MWAVIQHSNVEVMCKYLNVIEKAVKEDELSPDLLKLIVDRIYTEKYNFQIFGSQANIPMATQERIEQVKRKYNL